MFGISQCVMPGPQPGAFVTGSRDNSMASCNHLCIVSGLRCAASFKLRPAFVLFPYLEHAVNEQHGNNPANSS